MSTYADMFAVALLCLLSATQAAPLTCDDLTRPLDRVDPRSLAGRWALVAGAFSDPARLQFFKLRDSASVHFSNGSAASNISYSPSVLFNGECHRRTYHVSLRGGAIAFDGRDQANLTLTLVRTACPDCLAVRFDDGPEPAERFWLFSRRRTVEAEELEEFRAQVECLEMLPPAVLDPNKQLCGELDSHT